MWKRPTRLRQSTSRRCDADKAYDRSSAPTEMVRWLLSVELGAKHRKGHAVAQCAWCARGRRQGCPGPLGLPGLQRSRSRARLAARRSRATAECRAPRPARSTTIVDGWVALTAVSRWTAQGAWGPHGGE